MVSKQITRFFSILWLVTILLTTTGWSVQAVYCYCLETTYFTLEKQVSHTRCCAPVVEKKACCGSKVLSSTSCSSTLYPVVIPSKTESQNQSSCFRGEGCLETTEIEFDLKSDFSTVEESLPHVQSLSPYTLPVLISSFSVLQGQQEVVSPTNKAPPAPPPPISGRLRCILAQIYRC